MNQDERFLGRHGQTGNAVGHFIPAAFFLGLAVMFTVIILKRFRELGPTEHYCNVHIPEQNLLLMRRMGYFASIATILGILFEGFDPCLHWSFFTKGCFMTSFDHMVLYSTYGLIGPVLIMESNRKLPPDSHRVFLAFSSFCAAILWKFHIEMKEDMTDIQVHTLIMYTCITQGTILAYAAMHPRNLVAYVYGYGWFYVLSAWLITAGYNASFVRLATDRVAPYYIAQCLAAVMGGVWILTQHKGDISVLDEKEDGQRQERERLMV